MKRPIESVQIVSDGIVIRFGDGTISYFSQSFLRESAGSGANQLFVDHDFGDTSILGRHSQPVQ